MKKKIALIGGSGFIGHNLGIKLKDDGHDVIIVDSLSVNNLLSFTDTEITNKDLYNAILNERIRIFNEKNIKLIIQDARDYHKISQVLSEIKPDIVIHLAAVSHANKSNKDPHSTFDHSLRTLENTLDYAKNFKTHVIYMSSSMIYGNFNGKIVNEKNRCEPIGIYGTLKLSGELMVKSYNQIFELPYTIIRPSALYGERCVSRRVGQIFIENAIQGKEILIDGDGEDSLDFTYINDLVEGISSCCKIDKAKNETFNLTYGQGRTLRELSEILKKEFPNVKINYRPRDKFMPERGSLDITHAKNILNYKPSYPIEIGYQKYISWYKDFWNRKFKSLNE